MPLPSFFPQFSMEILLTSQGLDQTAFLWDSFFNPEGQNLLFLPLYPHNPLLAPMFNNSDVWSTCFGMRQTWFQVLALSVTCRLTFGKSPISKFSCATESKTKAYRGLNEVISIKFLGEENCGQAEGLDVSQCCILGAVISTCLSPTLCGQL